MKTYRALTQDEKMLITTAIANRVIEPKDLPRPVYYQITPKKRQFTCDIELIKQSLAIIGHAALNKGPILKSIKDNAIRMVGEIHNEQLPEN